MKGLWPRSITDHRLYRPTLTCLSTVYWYQQHLCFCSVFLAYSAADKHIYRQTHGTKIVSMKTQKLL